MHKLLTVLTSFILAFLKGILATHKRMLERDSHGLLPLSTTVFEACVLLRSLDLSSGSSI